MPTLTLLTNNTFINPSLFELVGMDQARITASSPTQITMTGSPGGGTYTLIGTGLTTTTAGGLNFINGGTVQTIEFRLINTNFDITNLNMAGNTLGFALFDEFIGDNSGAVEQLFLGLDYTINGTAGNNTHVLTPPNSADGIPLLLTGNNLYNLAGGNDGIFAAGTGNDTISGGSGEDDLRGGIGTDSLLGGDDNDTLIGEAGNDTLLGGTGQDSLFGGEDDDLLRVDTGLFANEEFYGGSGIDTLSFAGLDFGVQGGYVVVLGDQTVDFNTGGFLSFVTDIETVLGSVQGDSFSGDGLANLLDGREGNDMLVGLGGNDTLIGGAGFDRLFGGNDSDLLLTGSTGLRQGGEIYDGDGGIDTFSLEGLAFDGYRVNIAAQTADLLAGGFQATVREVEIVIGSVDGDEITGSSGSDTLEGRQGSDTLIGDNGSDQLDGGTGADSMIGGQGNDLYLVDDAGDVVVETGNAIADGLTDEVSSSVSYSISDAGAVFIERLRLTGTDNLDGTGNGLNNRLTGNSGNNNLLGLNGNDSIFGGDGRDTLNGGSGNDAMFGNEGDDTYIVFDALDVASEAVNGVTDEGGTDTVEAFVSYSLNGTDGRQFIENLTLTPGGNAVTGIGNGLDNIVTGNEAINVLEGLGGNDTLFGGIGNDVLIGGDGFDRLFGGADDDNFGVITSEGAVVGSEDSIDGGTGIDSVEFASGAGVNAGIDLVFNEYSLDGFGTFGAILGIERVTTGSGDDGVVGNLDTIFVDLGAGNDSVELATLTTEARGGEGDDTLTLLSLGSAITINLSTLTLQTSFENLFLTSFDDNGTGTEAANLLAGGSGNDTLNGLGGADRLFGGFDNDELNGGAGNDTLDGGAGFDRLFGGADDDDFGLVASQSAIVVLEDSIDGGTGIDRVAFDSGAGVNVIVDLQAGDYTFDGFGTSGSVTGIERVTTGSGDDSVAGNGDTTFIDVGAGNDEVGLTTLTTEARGGEGTDRLDLRAFFGPAIIDLSTSTLQTGFENLNLTDFADSATGTDAANDLFGGFGNDTLNGLGGNDLIFGGDNNDRLSGGADSDTLNGDDGNDALSGGAEGDALNGGSGNDLLDGGTGADTMEGGLGNDFYIVDDAGDVIQGEIGFAQGGGIDTVRVFIDGYVQGANIELVRIGNLTDTDNFSVTGNDAPGTLVGNAGANTLNGRGGNDQINGNGGGDRLIGGEGRDTLVGGTGADTFVFSSVSNSRAGALNRDVINGFERGAVQDVIDLSAIDANTLTPGVNNAFTFIGAAAFALGGASAGQLRLVGLGGPNAVIVEGDINGDRVADFQVFVNGQTTMVAGDFVL